MCTSNVIVDIQHCDDELHAAAAAADHRSPNLDNSEACVKKYKHITNGHYSGTKRCTDNDNFDLWTLLGLESVKIIIHKTKDVFCSNLSAAKHIKTDPVEISIRSGQYGAGFKLVKKNGRFFSQEGYKIRENVTETAVDGDANFIFQNDSYIKMSEGKGSDVLLTQEVGGTSSTLKMSGYGGCYNFETETTDCTVSKDKIRNNVTETMVDGDANLALHDDSDVRMSEGEGGDVSPTQEVGGTSPTLNTSGGGGCYNFETETTDCTVSKDKIRDNVTETMVDGDADLTLHDGSGIRMSEGNGGDVSPTRGVGGTSSTLNMSGDVGSSNFETETTDCMVSEGTQSNLIFHNDSDIRMSEGEGG